MQLAEILDLSSHGPDTFVGSGPTYPWGGLYGGQIVAQALRAASLTVDDPELQVHSLRSYFIQRGDATEPVRFEVDRLRNGRSFCTRRVVARQAIGTILNLEASYQRFEEAADVETVTMPIELAVPESIEATSWSPVFDRRFVPNGELRSRDRDGAGRAAAWLRVLEPLEDASWWAASLAYLSDDLPTDAVIRAHPLGREPENVIHANAFSASLDHTIWFHRLRTPAEWQLHDFSCHTFVGGRGLSIGHVFAADGTHVATIAQDVLLRDTRNRPARADRV